MPRRFRELNPETWELVPFDFSNLAVEALKDTLKGMTPEERRQVLSRLTKYCEQLTEQLDEMLAASTSPIL
jgi:acyl-CoA reductase-like NAD-dependent aldehyde dehydrogenase